MSDGKLTLIILTLFALVCMVALAAGTGALANNVTGELNQIQNGR